MLLFLSDIAGSEIIVVLLVVLLLFGSKSIPGLARGLGKGMRQIQNARNEITNEIRKSTSEMKKDFDLQRTISETTNDLNVSAKKMADQISDPIQKAEREMQQKLSNPTSVAHKSSTDTDSISKSNTSNPANKSGNEETNANKDA